MLLENLNKEQLEAVTNTQGPLLIVAGAGTGKTTVVTRKIGFLVEQKLALPSEILALTFTEKAAGEMEGRTLELLPLGNYDLWISTFHSFCERVLKQHGAHIGLPHEFKLLSDTAQWMLVYKNFDQFDLDYYRPSGTPYKFIETLCTHFSKCKDELVSPEDYLNYAESLKLNGDSSILLSSEESILEQKRLLEISSAYHTYQKLLLNNDSLDFGDLINYTLKLFKERPNVLRYYQNHFKYVMVDEFQDTNFAQYELIKLLCNTGSKNLAVVGDDDQSIYKFRGASVSNILNFKKDFPELKQTTLIENYRSSQEILDLAYNFIKHNDPNRLEVELGINKRLNGHQTEPATIAVIEAIDIGSELAMMISKIIEIKKENPNITWNDFAILIRSNNSANEIIPRLESSGIPYAFMANSGLYKKPLVSFLINYMRLLNNFHDSSSLFKLLSFSKFTLEHTELSKITHYANKKTLSIYEALELDDLLSTLTHNSRQKIQIVKDTLNHHAKESRERGASELFAYIVKDLGLPELLEEDSIENVQNREYLEQFYKYIENFEQESGERHLTDFLYNLELEMKAGSEGQIKFDPENGPESLKILTIHASKGLEFENVFMPGMVDQRFPSRDKNRGIDLPDALVKDILPDGDFHLEEERRLFYVAITRAKKRIYFSWAKDYGGKKEKKPSIFLSEAELISKNLHKKSTGKVVFKDKAQLDRDKIVFHDIPETFSFTDLSTFEKCPLEYKYKNYLKLPLPGAPQLSFGITMHRVFQEYMQDFINRKNNSQMDLFGESTVVDYGKIELLEELYKKAWIDDWYATKKQKEEFKNKGKDMLKIFYKATIDTKPKPKYVEQFFKLPIGNFHFVGKIDRADETPDGLAIIDYKTGKVPSKKTKSDLDQLRVYEWASKEFLNEKVSTLCYWYLEAGEIVSEKLSTPDEMLDFQENILSEINNIIEAIKYDTFFELHKSKPQHFCQFEDYK